MAVKKGVKKREGENLTAKHIEQVIEALNAPKPITKTEACKILNISYNVKRLQAIIDEYLAEKEHDAKRRAANRGKPASSFEIQSAIEGHLADQPVAEIAKRLHRTTGFVKKIIEDVGLPEKSESPFNPALLPDNCVSEEFVEGQLVWFSKANAMAIVRKKFPANSQHNKQDYDCYRIFVLEDIREESPYFPQYRDYGGQYAVSAYYDLGSLEHLLKHGVDVYRPYRATFPNWLKK